MQNVIRQEVYQRIVLAKSLLRTGEASCTSRNDQMAFTRGILLLHDAAEAALGGDPRSNAHFPTTVRALIEEVCQTYLGLDFSSVSLKSLIRDDRILEYVNRAGTEIGQGKIEEGLISLAHAMYYICEVSTIPWPFFGPYANKEKEALLQFTQPYKIEHTVELIQHGVDPFLYHRFKNLTPSVAEKRDTGELFYWWDKHYGHPANWTLRNGRFCLDFCIETALKFQREEDEGYALVSYREVFEDVIQPTTEEATIWSQPVCPSQPPFPEPSEPRSPVLVLKKGESIVGLATDSENRLDEWLIVSKDIPSKLEDLAGYGFVLKSDVRIIPRKKEAPKGVDDSEPKR